MEKFAGYGFNKSHSAAYAYLAFVTAYLKAHYPLEFMSALLTSETGNTAKVVKYINECREMGIRVLPPDVNSSEFTFTPVATGTRQGIRFGLGAIKNVGASAVDSIVKARAEGGPFGSLYDFCERVDLGAVNRRMIESLIKAGAMDSLEGTRAQLFAVIDSAMETGARAWKDRASGQSGLFAALMEEQPAGRPSAAQSPGLDRPGKAHRRKRDARILHHRPSARSVHGQGEGARDAHAPASGRARQEHRGRAVRHPHRRRSASATRKASCGPRCRSRIWKARSKRWCSPRNMSACCRRCIEDKAVLVRGLVLPEENAPPKISVQDIVPLEVARVNLPSLISIRVPRERRRATPDRAAALHELFARKPGETEVRLRLEKSPRLLGYPGRTRQSPPG